MPYTGSDRIWGDGHIRSAASLRDKVLTTPREASVCIRNRTSTVLDTDTVFSPSNTSLCASVVKPGSCLDFFYFVFIFCWSILSL